MIKFVTVVVLLSLAIATGGCGKGDGTVVLKVAEVHPADYPTTLALKKMAAILKEKSGGRISLEVQFGGRLGSEKETIELCQQGALSMTRVSCGPVAEFSRPIGVLNLPYLFRDREHLWKVLNGDVGRELLDGLREQQLVGLVFYDAGARSFYNNTRPVTKPEDLKGLKIRVMQSNVMQETVGALGGSPVAMSVNEVYSALQTGIIDGAENNPPTLMKHHLEVAKYYSLTEHFRSPELLLMSRRTWDSLPEEDRKLIQAAATESVAYQMEEWAKLEKEAMEAIRKSACKVNTVETEPFRAAVAPLMEKYRPEYGNWIKRIQEVR